MCTVTYLPQPKGFVLTHNRDEAPSRSPKNIVREKTPAGNTLLFPRDTMAGGTWIATSRDGRTACLLNGAFVLHTRKLPYRLSRGLILLDFFDWEHPDAFFTQYDLDNVEPFTFLFFEKSQPANDVQRVTELRWDGQNRHLKEYPPTAAHFWCSATLYPADMQLRREQVFREWLKKNTADPKSVLQLHRQGSIGDPENDYVMNRAGKVQTLSITQVMVDEKNAQMRYLDLLGENQSKRWLKISQRSHLGVNRY